MKIRISPKLPSVCMIIASIIALISLAIPSKYTISLILLILSIIIYLLGKSLKDNKTKYILIKQDEKFIEKLYNNLDLSNKQFSLVINKTDDKEIEQAKKQKLSYSVQEYKKSKNTLLLINNMTLKDLKTYFAKTNTKHYSLFIIPEKNPLNMHIKKGYIIKVSNILLTINYSRSTISKDKLKEITKQIKSK